MKHANHPKIDWAAVAEGIVTVAPRHNGRATKVHLLVLGLCYGGSRRGQLAIHTKLHVGIDLMWDLDSNNWSVDPIQIKRRGA